MGGVMIVNNIFVVAAARPIKPLQKSPPDPIFELSAFMRLDYSLFVAGACFNSFSSYSTNTHPLPDLPPHPY
jgi:hypothetical protein